jgi:2-iminobutanoate/2-iminopropanoate deaminase
MKKIINTDNAPAPVGPYSQAVQVGNVVYCSGQIALDAVSGEVLKGPVEAQTQKVMENIRAVLNAADLDFKNVVKTMIFLTDMNDFAKVNEVYAQYFSAQPPARSTVAVSALPKGVQVEIEVIAVRD